MGYGSRIADEPEYISVKVPVFSTEKLPQVEVSLGPEMRSTGEVLGLGKTYTNALYKGFLGAKINIPKFGSTILATIRSRDQLEFVALAKRFEALGCKFMATEGTAKIMNEHDLKTYSVKKIGEGVPNILDIVRSGLIDLIIDIPKKGNEPKSDGFKIRRVAAETNITLLTSMDTALAMLEIMESGVNEKDLEAIPIGRY
jgi:carbamoyl-phosphate synthase large subunit